MNKQPIPKKVKIFQQTYIVKTDNYLCGCRGALGTTGVNAQEIFLADNYDDATLPPDRIFKTFCHELTHAMLWEVGEHKLYEDEKFCENFGNALCTFLTQNCKWK